MSQLVPVPAASIDAVWDSIVHLIAPAVIVARGRFYDEDVKKWLKEGDAQLWVVVDEKPVLVLVTQILEYARKRVCDLLLCGGELPGDWLDQLAKVEAWALAKNCQSMEMRGRQGWQRKLPGYGFAFVVMEKSLCPVVEAAAKT